MGTRTRAFASGKGLQSLDERKDLETKDLPRLAKQAEMLGGACPLRMSGRAAGMCFAYQTLYTRLVRQEGESVVVRTHQMLGEAWSGQRVLSRGESRPSHRLDAERYRLVCVELDYGDGYGVMAVLLRPLAWLESQVVVEGGEVHLDLEEKGAVGWGRVCWVRPSPVIEDGPGSLVTGWFYHWRGVLHELRVSGEPEPLRVTARHPFWSVDGQRWVPAIELAVGERLERADGGVAVVESLALRQREEPVFNLEVDGDHCYRVGQQGLLVHNMSAKGTDPKPEDCYLPCSKQTSLFEKPDDYTPPNANLLVAGALRKLAIAIHALADAPIVKEKTTVALAEVICPGGRHEIHGAVSSYNYNAAQAAAFGANKVRLIVGTLPKPIKVSVGGGKYVTINADDLTVHAERIIMNNLRDGAKIIRWGIAWASNDKNSPCDDCKPFVAAFPGNATIE